MYEYSNDVFRKLYTRHFVLTYNKQARIKTFRGFLRAISLNEIQKLVYNISGRYTYFDFEI